MTEINLDAEINELAEQIASEGAKYVQKKLMAEMPSLLEYAFYSAYDPIWYNRTDNIKNNSYFPYSLRNSKMCEGGIEVSSAFMDEYKHGKWTPEKVMQEVWFRGNHGDWVITSPIPFDYITNYVHSSFFENDVWKHITNVCLK